MNVNAARAAYGYVNMNGVGGPGDAGRGRTPAVYSAALETARESFGGTDSAVISDQARQMLRAERGQEASEPRIDRRDQPEERTLQVRERAAEQRSEELLQLQRQRMQSANIPGTASTRPDAIQESQDRRESRSESISDLYSTSSGEQATGLSAAAGGSFSEAVAENSIGVIEERIPPDLEELGVRRGTLERRDEEFGAFAMMHRAQMARAYSYNSGLNQGSVLFDSTA